MWVRRVLVSLLLALFIFSIFGTVSARLFPGNIPPPRTNNEDPWAGTQKAGQDTGTTRGAIGINNSCSLIFIGNIPVGVFKVEMKNQMPFEAKKGK
ncbi:MAG: hypothetical protein MUO85_01560 [candidate division Zixibacteria bacterium]|nr:hypothetical protein [candidate division Zixibacteria bacterium]